MAIKLELGLPSRSWIRLRIVCEDQSFDAHVSGVPDDSITALVDGLVSVARGIDDVVVPFHLEPEDREIRFVTGVGETVALHVASCSDAGKPAAKGQVLFECESGRREMCLAFWRALRRLETSMSVGEYAEAWGHAFPREGLERLGALVRD